MASTVSARVNYLNNAAHLLSSTSPSTSAFLQARINDLSTGRLSCDAVYDARSNGVVQFSGLPLSNEKHFDVCASCGSTSWTKPLKIERGRQGYVKECSTISAPATKQVYVRCSDCGAKAYRVLLKQEQRRESREPAKPSNVNPTPKLSSSKSEPAKSSRGTKPEIVVTSNRKRSKGGKSSSLSALLAKSKQQGTSERQGFGLDLMDLMKST